MGTEAAEMEESVAAGRPETTLYSKRVIKDDRFDRHGVKSSGPDKRQRLRRVFCYMRRISPACIFRKVRDCYVSTLRGCAQNYSNFQPAFGGLNLMSCNASPLPPSFRVREEEYRRSENCLSPSFKRSFNDENCLSPGFKRSFNESYCRTSDSSLGSDGGSSPFRKSFSDFESCSSPTMRRAYSEAAALYSRSPVNQRSGCGRSSPGWTPNRVVGGQSMIMFPIEEAPEHTRPSFRKESTTSQELSLASFRKESPELNGSTSFKKDAGLMSTATAAPTAGTTTTEPMPNVNEVPKYFHLPSSLSTVSS